MKTLLSKYKENAKREFVPTWFNSTLKTVIVPKHILDKSFQSVFSRIANWVSEEFGWIIESIDAEYVSISI